ncbi:DUF551 domain-containing protein [Agrobacterium radiobacter]|uniref:DUF551 domain-containing protein n=1 Tax=Agrobacterium radiobacter TaxID=362 RepID=UPI003F8284B6
MQSELSRPIVGIENRTAQEVFDIMCDRFRAELGNEEAPRYTTRRLHEEIRKAEERGRQHEREAALSAAEPRGYLVHDKDNPNGRYFKQKPSISDDDMSEYEIWIEPLYAAPPAPSLDVKAIELDGVPDALAYGKGIWRTCTGCHESNEGYPTGPFSDTLKCHLGGGCFECGGIGAVWDTTDYEDMGNFIALSAQVQDVAGWRPIETAPKDESIIMLFRADEKHWASISTGYFKNDRFARNPKPYWGGPHERSLGIRWYRENPPTHWMPLPEAPK